MANLIVVALTLVFCGYFGIDYYMANRNYDVAIESSQDLAIIFRKEQCLDNLLIFLRENLIRNESVVFYELNTTVASSLYFQYCL